MSLVICCCSFSRPDRPKLGRVQWHDPEHVKADILRGLVSLAWCVGKNETSIVTGRKVFHVQPMQFADLWPWLPRKVGISSILSIYLQSKV